MSWGKQRIYTIIRFRALIVYLREVDLLSGQELGVSHISLLICPINSIQYAEILFNINMY